MATHKTSYILLLLFIFISCASKQTILKEDQEKILENTLGKNVLVEIISVEGKKNKNGKPF